MWHPDKNPGRSEDACSSIGHTVPCDEPAEEMFIRISKANDAYVLLRSTAARRACVSAADTSARAVFAAQSH